MFQWRWIQASAVLQGSTLRLCWVQGLLWFALGSQCMVKHKAKIPFLTSHPASDVCIWAACLVFFPLVMERNCHLLKGIKLNYHGHLFQGEMTGQVEEYKWSCKSALFCIMFMKIKCFYCCQFWYISQTH